MNYEFKGTPPPWYLSTPKSYGSWAGFNTNKGLCIGVYAAGDDLEAICQVRKDNLLVFNEQDHEANAHLIAAAPELLQACIDAFNFIEQYNCEASQGQINDLSYTLQSAINKSLNINQ